MYPPVTVSPWLNCFVNYLASNDTDWSYWALNGAHADEGIARGADPGLGVQVRTHHVRALGGQRERDGAPYAPRRAGDQRGSSGKPGVQRRRLLVVVGRDGP